MAQNFTGKMSMGAFEADLKDRLRVMGVPVKGGKSLLNTDVEPTEATKPKPLNGNDPCHCGSDIRFDLCCGKVDY